MKAWFMFSLIGSFSFASHQVIIINLSGDQEVPSITTAATGIGVVTINADRTEMSVYITHNASTVNAGHIHMGASDENGPVIFPFDSADSPIQQTFAITEDDYTTLAAGNFYFNIHSDNEPAGELRGQLRLNRPLSTGAAKVFKVALSGDQEAPSIESASSGTGLVVLSADRSEMSVFVSHNIPDVTAGHIHNAAAGQNGDVVFPFDSAESPIKQTFEINTDQIAELEAGNMYFNLHSTANPPGELRGQIGKGTSGYAFKVTINNLTKSQIFSPPGVIVHSRQTAVFEPGTPASDGLAIMAEDGNAMPLLGEALATDGVSYVTVADGPVMPGASLTLDVLTTGAASRISVLGMLITTNDAFFAAQGLAPPRTEFFKNGGALSASSSVMAFAWDAGSEANNEDCGFMPGPPCGNGGVRSVEEAEGFIYIHNGIHGIGDLDTATWDWKGPVARVTVSRN